MPLKAQKCFIAASQCLDLEHMLPNPRFSVTPALDEDLPGLATMTARHIPGLKGTYPALAQVQRHSRSILAIRNRQELVGCFAALLLNDSGFARLLQNSLSIADPSQEHLARPGETAAAIYVWAVCAPGMAVGAAGNVMQWLKQDSYARADLYAKPSTLKGNAFMIRAGFHPLAGTEANLIWVYDRPR
jgi:hypothetical protein